ncbi:hypothetical protein [Streptomyces sp. NPDC048361]|uniref:hypothetical protein n=1 Tax=Streptomyces sp. NPDC048361 TaxID=3154720 RepID=UPI003443FEC2
MPALSPRPASTATAGLPSPAKADATPHLGYWYESLHYPTAHAPVPTAAQLIMLPTAFRAIRTLRCELRAAHVFAVGARESRRAVDWADSGYVAAMAVLCQGRGIGFTLPLHTGGIAEWHIHPTPYLQLTAAGWCDGPGGAVRPWAPPSTAR